MRVNFLQIFAFQINLLNYIKDKGFGKYQTVNYFK